MALTIGIVGLPNVGKSTLFNALTGNTVLAANYPFATIDPNVGVVNLPDARLNRLAEIFGSELRVRAWVTSSSRTFVRRTLSPRWCVRLMTRTSFTWTARLTLPPIWRPSILS